MMSGLMLVFLFIAIGFMIEVESQKDAMKSVAESYRDSKANLNENLYEEFEQDLKKWDAQITKDNTVIFNSPDVLFAVNKSDIKNGFKTVLKDFFPRYLSIITSAQYINEIKEVRVEGHTSNEWGKSTSKEDIYLNNMKLSQSRSFKVLSFCYALNNPVVIQNRSWLESYFRASGMAFAKLKKSSNSRRVEFTLQMKSEDRVYEILK